MFALISLKRLPTQINLKCDPEKAVQLREQYVGNILPGYHMNKTHWNTILCEKVSPTLIKELMDHSYQTIVRKLPKSKQMLLKEVP